VVKNHLDHLIFDVVRLRTKTAHALRAGTYSSLATDHIRNEHDTLENTDHFCGFLLQMWSAGGRKERFQPESKTKIPAREAEIQR